MKLLPSPDVLEQRHALVRLPRNTRGDKFLKAVGRLVNFYKLIPILEDTGHLSSRFLIA